LLDADNEPKWWAEHKINPKAEAEKLWRESHAAPEEDLPVVNLAASDLTPASDGEI
jgi:hypothetical protein